MLKEDKLDETGRTMLEVLGILAVMGVLSVAAVGTYRYVLNKGKKQELEDYVSKLVIQERINALNGSVSARVLTGPSGVAVAIEDGEGSKKDYFSVSMDLSHRGLLCEEMRRNFLITPALIMVDDNIDGTCPGVVQYYFEKKQDYAASSLTYTSGGKTYLCPENSTCTASDFTCNDEYYKSGQGCSPCPAGARTCTDANTITSCKDEYYLSGNNCVPVPENATVNESGDGYDCNSDYYKSGNACVPVPENATRNEDGTDFICNDGYYKSGAACASCPTGAETCTDANTATRCADGYYLTNGSCQACSGERQYSSAGATSCSTCDAGQKANSDHTECIDCNEGETCGCSGNTSIADGNGGCKAAVDCGHGTYANDRCNCDAGYYWDNTTCTICSAGTYAAAGASACTPCPDGTTSAEGSTSSSACERDWNCNTDISLATDEDHFCNEKCLSGCEVTDSYPSWSCATGYPIIRDSYTCIAGSCYSYYGTYVYAVIMGYAPDKVSCYPDYFYSDNAYYSVGDDRFACKINAGVHPVTVACSYSCFTADTPITLADGTCKRADEITYEDELLCWNFDEGKMDASRPIWIQKPMVSPSYNYLKFSDGSVLKTINQHRIFNREAGKFTYPMTDDTPIGTHTLNARGEWVTLVEKKVVEEEVTYYNIITYHHINCFAGNVLTSCRLNNIYPIQDLKFVKDNRTLVGYERFKEVDRKWYDGLRLAEQPEEINRKGDDYHGDNSLTDYVKRMEKIAQ